LLTTVLPDILAPNLAVVFVGTAKSMASARAGHYYANPQNMFWNLLEATGLAGDVWIGPSRDQTVLDLGIGLTDIVPGRAASSDALLKSGDYDLPGFIKKIAQYAPAVVAFNGEKAAAKVARHLRQPTPAEGAATWMIGEALVYRLPSSSSANATGGYAAKRAKWVEFGQWARQQAADDSGA
jgi:TDG/mug DNA glycosylase family protein